VGEHPLGQRVDLQPPRQVPQIPALRSATERVKAALLMRKEGVNEGWVFPSKKAQSGHITDREVSKQWLEAKRLAGIPEAVVLYLLAIVSQPTRWRAPET
jgi:hypothetical protein